MPSLHSLLQSQFSHTSNIKLKTEHDVDRLYGKQANRSTAPRKKIVTQDPISPRKPYRCAEERHRLAKTEGLSSLVIVRFSLWLMFFNITVPSTVIYHTNVLGIDIKY